MNMHGLKFLRFTKKLEKHVKKKYLTLDVIILVITLNNTQKYIS
jgi:hypothetical protein